MLEVGSYPAAYGRIDSEKNEADIALGQVMLVTVTSHRKPNRELIHYETRARVDEVTWKSGLIMYLSLVMMVLKQEGKKQTRAWIISLFPPGFVSIPRPSIFPHVRVPMLLPPVRKKVVGTLEWTSAHFIIKSRSKRRGMQNRKREGKETKDKGREKKPRHARK